MKQILIIEDEFPIAMDIETRLTNMGYDVIGIGDSFEEALALVSENEPDLILMDINIKGSKDGIEAADILLKICNAPIVFLTAYSEEKIFNRALELKPAGYLLKPFNELQLKSTIEVGIVKRKELQKQQQELELFKNAITASNNNDEEKLQVFIKDKYKIIKLNLQEVFRLEAMDNYTQIFSTKGKTIVNLFLKDVLEYFHNDCFIRIHRSHVINKNKVDYIEGNMVVIEGIEIPIGRKYRAELLEKLNILQ